MSLSFVEYGSRLPSHVYPTCQYELLNLHLVTLSKNLAQSAGAVEYIDCFSAAG